MSAALAAGCGSTSECGLCGACPETVSIVVRLAAGAEGPPSIGGAAIPCAESDPGSWICTTSTIESGAHTITVSAPGHAPRELTFTITPAPAGCCTCRGSFDDDVTLVPTGGDGGVDGGARDAATSDAAVSADAGMCDPSQVRFPMGGALEVGTLCDDVFVCLDDPGGAAAVMAAAPSFVCSSTPEGPCPATTCAYRNPGGPSTLDEQELADICAVTLLDPDDMECRVYL